MRRLATAVASVAVLLVAAPLPAAHAASSPALANVADCVRERGSLLVLALVDESASLQETDPTDARVTGLQAVLANLRNVVQTGLPERELDIELQLAGFSAGFTAQPWTKLDDTTYRGLAEGVDAFAHQDSGIDTDFASALDGARDSFAKRTAEVMKDGSQKPCQFLLMFTDGDYDIEPRTTAARRRLGMTKPYAPGIEIVDEEAAGRVVGRGRGAVCEPDGIADDLRADGVVTAAVALTPKISAFNQGFLRSVAMRTGGGEPCGRRGGTSTGLYLPATAIADLLFVLDEVLLGSSGATEAEPVAKSKICAPAPKPDPACTRAFEVDASLRAFHVLADLSTPGLRVELRSPGARRPLTFEYVGSRPGLLGSARVESGWLSPSALALDVTLPRETKDWVGTWSVTFIDPTGQQSVKAARSQIFVYGDLYPRLLDAETLRLTVGESTPVRVRVIDQKGTPKAPAGFVRAAALRGVLVDPLSKAQTPVAFSGPDAEGIFRGDVPVSAGTESALMNLTVTLAITTKSGLVLAPTSQTYPVPVAPPPSFPTVTPAAAEFGSITTVHAVRKTLTVTGGVRSSGCVWVESSGFDVLPDRATDVAITAAPAATSPESCVRVAAGETKQLDLELRPGSGWSGALEGHVVLRMSSEESDQVLTRRIPVTASVYVPVDEVKRVAWFVALLALGLLVPIAFLYLANRWLGRFAPTDGLRYAAVEVTTDGALVRRADTGALLDLSPLEFRAMDGTPLRVRRHNAHNLSFRVRQPVFPVAAPWGTAGSPGAYLTSQLGHVATRDGAAARLPLSLASQWILHVTEYARAKNPDVVEVTEATGLLHVFASDSASGLDPAPVVDKVQRELPARALAVAALKAREDEDRDGSQTPERITGYPDDAGERPLPRPPSYDDDPAAAPVKVAAPANPATPRAEPAPSVPEQTRPLPKPPDY